MRFLFAYAKLYKECLLAALAGTFKNPWTFLLPIVLSLASVFLGVFLSRFGFLGGILWMLSTNALLSTYLYFMCQIAEGSKTSPKEWKASLGRYFWAILNYFFIIWLGFLLLEFLFGRLSQWHAIGLGAQILCWVAFNAVPETLYIKGTHGSMETVRQSFKFIQENWVVWLLPWVPLLGAAWYFVGWQPAIFMQKNWLLGLLPNVFVYLGSKYFVGLYPFNVYGMAIVLGVFLHLFMAFRGVLFVRLDKSTHRQRMHRFGR
ncbi:MAG: hypothetical protein FWG75_10310 [Cystobacterineae bacterium]|nr:hypothetical protein [Cystobacterineae bacterium]